MVLRRLLWRALSIMVVLLVPATSPAQGPFRIKQNQSPFPIDEAAANLVIDDVVKRLDEEYIYPDVAAKMAQAVRKRQTAKEYAGIKTGQELAERLTRDLRDVSHDKHLRILCSTDVLPKPPRGKGDGGPDSGPPPEMRERMRQRMQWLNAGYRKVERLPGNIGYLAVDAFAPAEVAEAPAAAAMNSLANTDALIIDLRKNGGGAPDSVALLCSYFFDTKPVHLNTLYWRKGNRTEEFKTRKDLAGKRYLGKDVYLLTSARTFSGGEEFVYDMQTQKRATVVGETTGGGAHPGGMTPIGEHFVMFVPAGRPINPITKTDWEGTGVKPDVAVPSDEALEKAKELALKKLKENAKDDEARERIRIDIEHSQDKPTAKATAQSK
jgi:hypothetical protein